MGAVPIVHQAVEVVQRALRGLRLPFFVDTLVDISAGVYVT